MQEKEENLYLGIDVGSTTVKSVLLNSKDEIIFSDYRRHNAQVKETILEQLGEISRLYPERSFRLAITGSAGLGYSEKASLPFVQEVSSAALAVNEFYPKADAVVELGGEDAKIIFLTGGNESRMNGTCAGGTGAFIDQMATLLNVSLDELDALAMNATHVYPIASRCGVFAKSDIQSLLNQGAKKEDVAMSIFHSVVGQTITGLAQGREIKGTVLFLGGPLSFLNGLRKAFVDTLHLSKEEAIFPKEGKVFMGLGAALYAKKAGSILSLQEIEQRIRDVDLSDEMKQTEPLFKDEEEYREFVESHDNLPLHYGELSAYEGPCYLGIDAGSTTTKMMLLGGKDEILYSQYAANNGSPLSVIQSQLSDLYARKKKEATIVSSCVIGYGEDLIKSAFGVDYGLVETSAHYQAARYFAPNVDFVIDIGGQDIKCFKTRNGAIDSLILNEACSSGCGSFIQSFANALGYSVVDFARLGLFAKHPVELGSRCTVFMNSSVKQAQKDGASVEDISAGLSGSVIKNAIYKVIRFHSPEELGKTIVCQGGTFLNDAILRSFEREVGHPVIRPKIAGLMGAFGAALYAKEKGGRGGLISPEELAHLSYRSRAFLCQGCGAHCSLTLVSFPGGKHFIAGNKCDKGAGIVNKNADLDFYAYKLGKLRQTPPQIASPRGRVGLPLALLMYEQLPFWEAFFSELGYQVVLNEESSRDLYFKGQNTIASDTVCYPAKLMHGCIASLLEKGVDFIFYPAESYNFDEKKGDNHFNCPVVAYYSELLNANNPALKEKRIVNPYLDISNRAMTLRTLAPLFRKEGLSRPSVRKALKKAYEAMEAYEEDNKKKALAIISEARKRSCPIIVLAGRPYHLDPEVNHAIPALLTSLGFALVSEDVAASLEKEKHPVDVLNQWTYHARLYQAANYVSHEKDMQLVQLISFGCGVDAITSDEVRAILERNGKFYTALKIDEVSNLGAAKIRLRSLQSAWEKKL